MKLVIVSDADFSSLSPLLKEILPDLEVWLAPIGTLETALMTPPPFAPDVVLFFPATESALRHISEGAATHAKRWSAVVDEYKKRFACRAVLGNLPDTPYPNRLESSLKFIRDINSAWENHFAQDRDVTLLSVADLAHREGLKAWHDPRLWYVARFPCAPACFDVLTQQIIQAISPLRNSIKAIVVDFDNTLWGGTIGDDGLTGLVLGGSGPGEAFVDFQQFLKTLHSRGIVLVGCTRNTPEQARLAFAHSGMVLKYDDFSLVEASHQDKASALQIIKKKLNLLWDSILFLDDSPYERELAQRFCPGLNVLALADDPADRLQQLQAISWSTPRLLTDEDRARTERVKTEQLRQEAAALAVDIPLFLQSLEMKAELELVKEEHLPRLHDLFSRTNQYNFTTTRPTLEQLRTVARDPQQIFIKLELSDKFGHYGLIAAAIVNMKANLPSIDAFILSCRAAARGIEELILMEISHKVAAQGHGTIRGQFIASEKNQPISQFYKDHGFTKIDHQTWEIKLSDLKIEKFKGVSRWKTP